MSQKSSLPQLAKSVSMALIPDRDVEFPTATPISGDVPDISLAEVMLQGLNF